MEKIRKIFITLLSSLILLCNFSFVFAEEDVIDDNNENESLSENPLESSRNDDEIVIIDNTDELNNINNNLSNINNNLLSLNNSNIISNNRNIRINYNNFSSSQLNWYYENYDNYEQLYGSNSDIYYDFNILDYDYDNNNIYYNHSNHSYFLRNNGTIGENNNDEYNNLNTFVVNQSGFLKFKNFITNEYIYELRPFKLNIFNYGLGIISNSVNTEPYISTNIYYNNQTITLTYDNSNNDFNGWYINGEKVSDSLSYTFNINTDTNIYLNYYDDDIDSHKTNKLLTLVFIMLLFIMFRQFIWGV